jgi:hypothetical protein
MAWSSTQRWKLAVAIGAVAVALHNWWVVVYPAGWMPSFNALISEASASDQPHGQLLTTLDVVVGALLVVALVLRWRDWSSGPGRAVWWWTLVWATAGGLSGVFPMACSSTDNRACGRAEWRFSLPVHHYLHLGFGVWEFLGASFAILVAWRTPALGWLSRLGARLSVAMLVFYPFMGLTFFTKHLAAVTEPIFFAIFSTIGMAVICYRRAPAVTAASTA